jgi:hypothetical protein
MSNSKLRLALCMASFLIVENLALSQTVTPENETKARRALQQKMDELNLKEWHSNLQPVTLPSVAATYPASLTPDQEAKARQQLREKMGTVETETATKPAKAGSAPEPAAASQNSAASASPTPAPVESPVQATLTPDLESKARTELHPKMTELYAMEALSDAYKQASPRPSKRASTVGERKAEEMTAPASGPSQDRLKELDELYRDNKITPHEYHSERAKLLSTK